jgi:hypothetical protein
MSDQSHPTTEPAAEPKEPAHEPAKLPPAEAAALAEKKYQHTDDKKKRDVIRAKYAPIRATITHAANGDRVALASALIQLTDLHQDQGGPIGEDVAADHLRSAGAALTTDRIGDAEVALAAALVLLPPGPVADKVVAARAAMTAGDEAKAIKQIDEALDKAA